MAKTADVVIIGGGVIGCATAYELAKLGLEVVLMERRSVGAEASSASAGLLVPLHAAEEGERTPLFDLYWASASLYPLLMAELEEATGIRVDHDPSGSLRIAVDEDEAELLRESYDGWDDIEELTVEWVDEKAIHEVEPILAPDVCCGVLSRDEQSLHPGRLVQAMARAASQKGVEIRTGCPAVGIRQEGGRLQAVKTPEGELAAGELVIAAGAWSAVPCSWFGAAIPISPARGQMVSLRSTASAPRRPIFSFNGAILPKLDGSVQVGSTVELVGFDSRPTVEGIGSVLDVVSKLTPGLGEAPIDRIWAGLRPWCEDGVPAIGRLPGCDNVSLASGHFKLGILGSAITARTVADLVANGRVDPLIAPFSPSRITEGGG